MAEDEQIAAWQKTSQEALASEQVLKIYGNGFICLNSNADMAVIIQINQKPVAVINLSFTTAKTLGEKLGQMVRDFEKKTGNTIMTIDVINEKLKGSPGDVELQ
jgi:hypothetical protein